MTEKLTFRLGLSFFLILQVTSIGCAQIHIGAGQTYPTIYAAAHARVVLPGDTIFVHAGTYTDAGNAIDSLIGNEKKWIVIMPFRDDSVSIHVQYTFQFAQYLKVTGLHFFGNDPAHAQQVFHLLFFDYAYDCFTANHDIVIDHCTFDQLNNTGKGNTGACLKIDGTQNFALTNCSFTNGTNITDGISLNADLDGVVANCTFENMPGDGSHCKGGAKNITYQQNLFINCTADGIDVGGDTGPQFFCPLSATWEADSIHVYSNIFIGGNTGIRLSSCHNSDIVNNTCFKTNEFAFRSLNASSNPIYLSNNRVINNIFTTNSVNHIYMNASSGFNYATEYFENNLFHDYLYPDPASIDWSEMPGVNVTNSFIGDPDFSDTSQRDFSLKGNSPAATGGALLTSPVLDYYGRSFSQSSRSIGAIQFSSSGVAISSLKGFQDRLLVSAFPNPVSGTATVEVSLPTAAVVNFAVYNSLGERVFFSTSRSEASGRYEIPFDVGALPSGLYWYRVQAGDRMSEEKLDVIH